MTIAHGVVADPVDEARLVDRAMARRRKRLEATGWGARFIAKRLAASLLTLLIVTLAIFTLVRSLGGDIARTSAGADATPEQVEAVRGQMGLDEPLPQQYLSLVTGLVTGDLGESFRTRTPVSEEILTRLPATLKLAIASTVVGSLVGIALGTIAATRRGSWIDTLASLCGVTGISIPVFWLGLMLISVFSVKFELLPVAGDEGVSSLVLPAITLAVFPIGLVTRMTRASLLDTLGSDYVRTALAKGTSQATAVRRHCLRNAALPVVTIIGLHFGSLLGGAVLVESVFAWPGLGRYLVAAVETRDIAVVQGLAVVFALIYIVVNLILDLLYVIIDPRLRVSS